MQSILTDVLQLWLQAHEWQLEQKLTRALQRQAATQKDSQKLLQFWNRRPTRLFQLLPEKNSNSSQQFFCFLDSEVSRLPDSLKWNRYSFVRLQRLQQLAENAGEFQIQPVAKGFGRENVLAYPLLVEFSSGAVGNHPEIPNLIFADFILAGKSLAWGNSEFFASSRSIVELFCEWFADFSDADFVSMPLLVNDATAVAAGNSWQLAFLTQLWLNFHRPTRFPSLCVTGALDCQNGMIKRVSGIQEKIEAGLNAGFSFIIIPAENLCDLHFRPGNLIAVAGVDEWFHWLLMHCGERLLSVSAGFSAEDQFVGGMEKIRHNGSDRSPDDRLNMLIDFVSGFPEINRRLPAFLRFARLPGFLHEMITKNILKAEQCYLQYCRALSCGSSDALLASRLLCRNLPFELLRHREFSALRRRFPLILFLFFREPLEMLYFFSFCKSHEPLEIQAIQLAVRLLDDDSEKYCRICTSPRSADEIFRQIALLLFPEISNVQSFSMVVRKRLVVLFRTIANLKGDGCGMPLYLKNEVTRLCYKLIRLHLQIYQKQNPVVSGDFSDLESLENLASKSTMSDPVLRPLARELLSQKHSVSKKNLFLRRRRFQLENEPKWLPNPGLLLARQIFFPSDKFNLSGFLNSFSRQIYQEPAGELMNLCLAHWHGMMRQIVSGTNDLTVRLKSGLFNLASHIGAISALKNSDCRGCMLKDTLNGNFAFNGYVAFMLLMLPDVCRDCWIRPFTSFFARMCESRREIRRKDMILCMMLAAVTAEKTGQKDLAFVLREWNDQLSEFHLEPGRVRRTMRAVIPLFYLLTGSLEKAYKSLDIDFYSLNRPFFAHEYFRCFVLRGSPQNLGNWHSRFEKEIFDALAIGYLYEQTDRLRDFLLHNYLDHETLSFGIRLLKMQTAIFHRQPNQLW